jgi:nucleoside-diphosphate-sugar epimerase
VNHPVYIDDLLAGIVLALERGRAGEVYIIGGERPVTKKELVDGIADALAVPRPRRSIPRWLAAGAAPIFEALGRAFGFEPILTRSRVMMMADNFGYSIAKARRELGFEPKVPLREGIARTVEDFLASGVL